jgi:hypothetical protein
MSSAGAVVIAIMVAVTPFTSVNAQIVESAAPFLLLPIGARLVGIGGAGVADPTGQDALMSNPAALARPRRREMAIDFGKDGTYPDGRYIGSAAVPVRVIGTFALGLYIAPQPRFENTDSLGMLLGSTVVRDVALSASYASHVTRQLLAGVTYKFVQRRYDCSGGCDPKFAQSSRGATTAIDFGLQLDSLPAVPIHFGIALRNIGPALQFKDNDQSDPLPTQLAVGAAYDVQHFERVLPGATLRGLVEVTSGVGAATLRRTYHVGAELRYQRTLLLRAGYAERHTPYSGPALGIGFVRSRLTLDVTRQLGTTGLLAQDPPTYVSLRFGF